MPTLALEAVDVTVLLAVVLVLLAVAVLLAEDAVLDAVVPAGFAADAAAGLAAELEVPVVLAAVVLTVDLPAVFMGLTERCSAIGEHKHERVHVAACMPDGIRHPKG